MLTPLINLWGIEFHILELVIWFFIVLVMLVSLQRSSSSLIIYSQKYSPDLSIFFLGVGVFLLSILCSHILGMAFSETALLKALMKWLEIFSLATLFYLIIRSERAFEAVYALLAFILSVDIFFYLFDIGFISRSLDYTSLRAAPTYSALFLMALLVPFVQRSWWIKFAIAILGIIIIASLSRGAILGLALLFTAILLSNQQGIKSMAPLLASVTTGLLLVFMLLAPEQRDFFAETLTHRFSFGATASNVERQGLTAEAIRLFKSHSIFGIGAERFSSYLSLGYSNLNYISTSKIDNLTPHNFFLQVAAEQGVVGLIGLLLWLGGIACILRKFNRGFVKSAQTRPFCFGLQLVLLVLLVQLTLGYMAGGFRIILGIYLGLVLTLSKLNYLRTSKAADIKQGSFNYDY